MLEDIVKNILPINVNEKAEGRGQRAEGIRETP
jgi:hypothetical protein